MQADHHTATDPIIDKIIELLTYALPLIVVAARRTAEEPGGAIH